jgi:uncharacterized protein (TIGR03083 family)
MPNDVWPMVHVERRALIDDLAKLDDTQWTWPSLCDGWTVHDVVAHIIDSAQTTRLGFVLDMARARFDFDRQNANASSGRAAPRRGRRWSGCVGRRREPRLRLRPSTPGSSKRWCTARTSVGRSGSPAPIRRTRSSDRCASRPRTSESFGGAKELVGRIRLEATDLDLSTGDGPEVSGPALALLLVISGRRTALAELDGPGVALLDPRVR